jgi:hypothetical protein
MATAPKQMHQLQQRWQATATPAASPLLTQAQELQQQHCRKLAAKSRAQSPTAATAPQPIKQQQQQHHHRQPQQQLFLGRWWQDSSSQQQKQLLLPLAPTAAEAVLQQVPPSQQQAT